MRDGTARGYSDLTARPLKFVSQKVSCLVYLPRMVIIRGRRDRLRLWPSVEVG